MDIVCVYAHVCMFNSQVNYVLRILGNYLMWRAVEDKIDSLPERYRSYQMDYIQFTTGRMKYTPRREACVETAREV